VIVNSDYQHCKIKLKNPEKLQKTPKKFAKKFVQTPAKKQRTLKNLKKKPLKNPSTVINEPFT
jgi:hypothetical protein